MATRPVLYGAVEIPADQAPEAPVVFRPKQKVPTTRVMAGALVAWSLLLAGLLVALRRHDGVGPIGSRLRSALMKRPSRSRLAHSWHSSASRSRSSSSTSSSNSDGSSSSTSSISLEFSVENEYGAHVSFATAYTWLNGYKLVEPYRQTNLTISSPLEGHTYEFSIYSGSELIGSWSGNPSVTMEMTATGEYEAVVKALDAEMKTVATSTETVFVKYVRREIRSLSDGDRDDFMDAAHVLWYTDEDEGISTYGDDFKNIDFFNGYHLSMAGLKNCDHMHDGLGFMTQHLALTLKFDKALRAVNPKVVLPYWDFTIDIEQIRNFKGGNYSEYFLQAEVFSDDYFGAVNLTTGVVETGRWAKVPVKTSRLDVKNAYGLARAPWNSNKTPYITRTSTFCGQEVVELTAPDCTAHYDILTGYRSWFTFGQLLAYSPHGPIHVYGGGTINCDALYTTMVDLGIEKSFRDWFVWSGYIKLREYWREDIMECPTDCTADTPQEECVCKCDADELIERFGSPYNASVELVGESDDYDFLPSSDKDLRAFVDAVCTSGMLVGDQIEAASPNDIMFWPIHPTLERLWQAKKLWSLFDDETWVSNTSEYDNCGGHDADDTIPLKGILEDPDAYYTNQELYDLLNPSEGNLPHIYDDFTWSHCEADAGLDFSSIPVDYASPKKTMKAAAGNK